MNNSVFPNHPSGYVNITISGEKIPFGMRSLLKVLQALNKAFSFSKKDGDWISLLKLIGSFITGKIFLVMVKRLNQLEALQDPNKVSLLEKDNGWIALLELIGSFIRYKILLLVRKS
jgi:hypothetical protein